MLESEYREKLFRLESELSRIKSERLSEINSLREKYLLEHSRFLKGQKVGVYKEGQFLRMATVQSSYIDNDYVVKYTLVHDFCKPDEYIDYLDSSNNG